jgi:hypothetical protein
MMAEPQKKNAVAAFVALIAVGVVAAILVPMRFGVGGGGAPAAAEPTESTYAIAFGKDFLPQLASRDDLGISVVLAVDVSGSMSEPPASGGPPKYFQAAEAFARVVDVLERIARESPAGQSLKVGVLKFNEAVTPVLPLTDLDEAGIERLRGIVQDPTTFNPEGSTAIGLALETSVEWLSQSGTILRSAIVVTDGDNKTGVDPAWVLSAVYNNRNSASGSAWPVLTSSTLVSFIGFDIDAGRFAPLEKYGARVTAAADQAQLATALSDLLEADITKLESSDLGGGAK